MWKLNIKENKDLLPCNEMCLFKARHDEGTKFGWYDPNDKNWYSAISGEEEYVFPDEEVCKFFIIPEE